MRPSGPGFKTPFQFGGTGYRHEGLWQARARRKASSDPRRKGYDMTSRAKRLAAAAVLAALLTIAAAAAVVTSSSNAAAPLTGSITKTYSAGQCDNQVPPAPHQPNPPPACWYCTGPVDLDSVTITIDSPVVVEGVRLGAGCTGRIGKLTIVSQGSDPVKVLNGAHDLTIGGGSVTCGIPAGQNNVDTDQYGIRVWGGTRITFAGMYVNCQAKTASGAYASRFEIFINQGPSRWTPATDADKPTKVLFVQGCFASGPQKTVNIGTSLQSGVATSTVYPFITPSQGPTFDTPAVPGGQGPPADQPLNFANTFPAAQGSCAGTSG